MRVVSVRDSRMGAGGGSSLWFFILLSSFSAGLGKVLEWYSFLSSTLALSIKEDASWKNDTETAFFIQQLYRCHNRQVWGDFSQTSRNVCAPPADFWSDSCCHLWPCPCTPAGLSGSGKQLWKPCFSWFDLIVQTLWLNASNKEVRIK